MVDEVDQISVLSFRHILLLVLVLPAVAVVLYPLLPIPPYQYNATEVTPSNATLNESELRTGAERNPEVNTVGDLSQAGRDAVARALARSNRTATLDGDAPTLTATTYLAENSASTVYRVSISEFGDARAVTLEPVPNRTAVSILSVSLDAFDDGLSGVVHQSDREMVEAVVREGDLRTHRCVPANNTIVEVGDSYYRIRSDPC
jgi:hypothetical protein